MDYNHLLENKRVFVTSGIRGIGKAIAVLFANQGAVVAVGGKNIKLAPETEAELKEYNHKNRVILSNLSSKEETEHACDILLKEWGGVDILVNTVGINRHAEITDASDEELLNLYETNYMSGIRCIRKFIIHSQRYDDAGLPWICGNKRSCERFRKSNGS